MNIRNKLIISLKQDYNALIGGKTPPGTLLLPVSTFFILATSNLLSLTPYLFTPASHFVFSLSYSLPLWIGPFIVAFLTATRKRLAHLVPLNSPQPLAPFMVIIELTSNVVRPITLAVRLSANLIAGHLILTLASSPSVRNYYYLPLLLIPLVLIRILELAVALIQAYVFSTLVTLYNREALA